MRTLPALPLAALATLLAAGPIPAADPDTPDLARQAHAVLKTHCYRCHGEDGAVEGGMNYLLDFGQLVTRRKIVPGQPDRSPILVRIVKGQMPPAGEEPRPGPAEQAVLRRWIEAGAPAFGPAPASRTVVTSADVVRSVRADLAGLDRRTRRFQRYFTLTHLANAGLSADELQTYRHAVAKLLNSLSWHPKLARLTPVDPTGLVLRFDLREVMWDAGLWNRLLLDYPYGVAEDSADARAVAVATASRMPVVRADWFLATASRPPLYYDLLQIPTNLAELERQLRIDAAADIQQERVARAGFNGSGVSRNNRLLERHDSAHGYYWRTYDFDSVPQNLVDRAGQAPDRRNLFAYPLGPGGGDNAFQHAGGEAIFSLPNGLQGYLLVNALNVRVDKAPTAIVSDPRRPDRAVEPGLSCLSCHVPGIIPKADQVRDYVERNPNAFSRSDGELIRALYPPEARMKALMEADGERYRQAVAAVGAKVTRTEPVSTLALRYEADLDLTTAAAEVGRTPEEFKAALAGSESLTRNLGALSVAGGTVSRQVFVQTFGDLAAPLNLGVLLAQTTPAGLPDNTGDLDPLEGPAGQANAVAFAPEGRRALVAGADRSLRLVDVEAGRELRRLVGHTASVWSVAFAPDGRRALSGGLDGTMRLWDTTTGQELRRFDGHLSLVAGVAFSPDGRRALSAGYDQSVVLWDLDSGQELKRFRPGAPFAHLAAFTPDGQHALFAGDSGLTLWDLDAGRPVRRFESPAPVMAVAFDPDGQRFLAAGDDGAVRLWELDTGKELRRFTGHAGPVRGVAWSPDGRWAASAGADRTVRLWQVESGKELGAFRKHGEPVVQVMFRPDGRQTLSAGRDSGQLFWDLGKFGPPAPPTVASPGATTRPADEAPALRPTATLAVNGTVGNLTLSPNGKWLFYLNRADGTLVQADAAKLRATRTHKLPDGAETFALSPNGKALYTVAPTPDGKALFEVIDPVELTVRRTFTVAANPYDLAAADGRLYLTTASGGWADVTVIDSKAGTVSARWGGVWSRSFVRLSADRSRLYLGSQGIQPGKIDSLPLPSQPGDTPTVSGPAPSADAPVGGEFLLTPDGRYLLAKTGTVLRLAAAKADDLQPAAKVAPFLAAAVDPAAGVALVLTPGGWLKRYAYPTFRLEESNRLPGPAYQAAYDPQTGRLYLAVIDPAALGRPRAKGFGDLQVYEMKGVVSRR
jgi:WD40 repeat protein/mono/diheme cytochrome c family protein